MKGYRFFICDIRIALQRQKFFLISIVIFAALWIMGYLKIYKDYAWEELERSFRVGDILLYCFWGVEPVREINGIQLPTEWLTVFLGAHLSVLGYAEELTLYGQQLFYRSGKRALWWLSKCVWNIVATALYFTLGLSICVGMTIFRGGSAALKNIEDFLLLAIVLCMSWNLFQMYLSLYLGTFVSFLVSIVMLISSVYIYSPFLPGNYMMLIRTEEFWENGMKNIHGYLIAFLLTLIAVLGGILRIKHCDYLIKE